MPLTEIIFDVEEMNPGRGSAQSNTLGYASSPLLIAVGANSNPIGPANVKMQADNSSFPGGDPGPTHQWYSPNGMRPGNNYDTPLECAQENLNPNTTNCFVVPNGTTVVVASDGSTMTPNTPGIPFWAFGVCQSGSGCSPPFITYGPVQIQSR